MDAQPTHAENLDDFSPEKQGWVNAIFSSHLLWAAGMTVGFYALIPHLPVYRDFVERYCTGHFLAYVETTLFILGISILCLKLLSLRSQKQALQTSILDSDETNSTDEPDQKATGILMLVRELPERLHQTFLIRRIIEVCQYIRGQKSTGNLYEHQQYLSEIGAERLHESYGLVRTITWAVPILGFLGTVMGITIAIANVQPEQLQDSMDEVTGGLGIAFDTTTLALGLTLVLVFLTHWVEKAEQGVLQRVDELAFNRIGAWFPTNEESAGPLMKAEQQAAEELLRQTESVVTQQTEMWKSGMEDLRQRWVDTLDIQQSSLASSLQDGTESTLTDHAQQLASARSEMFEGYQTVAREINGMMSAQSEAMSEQQAVSRELMEQQRQLMLDEIATVREDMRLQTEQITQSLTAGSEQWKMELGTATQAMTAHLGQLQHQGELLSRIVEQEENLTRLQGSLSENLNEIRSAGAFDETLHSLSAAVHLLTMRTKAA